MVTFSANLGFLWADLPLPAAIRAAKAAGFDAVECHWPYATPPTEITAALKDTGLEMLGLNTPKSAGGIGLFGLSALPGHEALARAVIDQSLSFAADIGARSLHVMAGMASGAAAQASFCTALSHACHQAKQVGMTILIEPLNRYDAPAYFLNSLAQAEEIITSVNHPNLKLMFDCYHVGRTEGRCHRPIAVAPPPHRPHSICLHTQPQKSRSRHFGLYGGFRRPRQARLEPPLRRRIPTRWGNQ